MQQNEADPGEFPCLRLILDRSSRNDTHWRDLDPTRRWPRILGSLVIAGDLRGGPALRLTMAVLDWALLGAESRACPSNLGHIPGKARRPAPQGAPSRLWLHCRCRTSPLLASHAAVQHSGRNIWPRARMLSASRRGAQSGASLWALSPVNRRGACLFTDRRGWLEAGC